MKAITREKLKNVLKYQIGVEFETQDKTTLDKVLTHLSDDELFNLIDENKRHYLNK